MIAGLVQILIFQGLGEIVARFFLPLIPGTVRHREYRESDPIREVERKSGALLAGVAGGKAVVGSKDGTVLPVVMAVAAVVNAVASVIDVDSATYVATKWELDPAS